MDRKEFLHNIRKAYIGLVINNNKLVDDLGDAEKNKLQEYINDIDDEFQKHETVVLNNDLFYGFKKLTDDQRISDFQMYFPIYKAGEIKNNIPWFLLWIIHVHETTVSREVNPEINGYKGAMQRSARFYKDEVAIESAKDWEFLRLLPQRYLKNKGYRTNDYEEILFASKKIFDDSNNIMTNNQSLNWEQSFLAAQERYCAKKFANDRVDRYLKIKPFFTNS